MFTLGQHCFNLKLKAQDFKYGSATMLTPNLVSEVNLIANI